MSTLRLVRRAVMVVAAVGVLGVFVGLSQWASVRRNVAGSLNGHLGIPDCPDVARQDLLSHRALECWLYEPGGAWRIVSVLSAHGAVVIEVEVTGFGMVHDVADTLVGNIRGRFVEVLVYASQMPDVPTAEPAASPNAVERVRWTPESGFVTLRFQKTSSPRAGVAQ